MTTNFNTKHQITEMKTKVNRSKIAKETLSGSTNFFKERLQQHRQISTSFNSKTFSKKP